MQRSASRGVLLSAIGVLATFLGGCGAPDAAADRVAIGRLAGQMTWRSCDRGATPADSSTCATPRISTKAFTRLATAFGLARQRLDVDSSAEALHDAALFALRLRDSTPTGLPDAARFLERARKHAPTDRASTAAILNDFAVVQLELGQREQSVRPLLAALDAIQRAVAADSTFPPALFNQALILQRLYLLSTAQRAWTHYLSVERDDAWKREAQSHEARLAVLGRASSVSQNRDEAFRLLGEWGRAVVARDSTRAGAALDSARRVAATIDTMPDQSVRLALRTVDSAGGRKATLGRLAAAHMEYSDGFAASNRAALEQAADHLARAERELRVLGSAAAGWAGLYRASAEYQLGWYDTADHTLLDVLAGASRQQQPALVGKAVSAQGVIQIRRGNFELAGHLYRQAATDLARAKEQYNEGGAYYLLAESLNSAGQHAAGDGFAYRALRLLSPYNKSNFLNNNLVTVAAYARAYALPYAAFAVMDEAMVVGRGLGKLDARALAYRTRASDLFAAGRPDLARAELATAMLIADSLEGHSKERVRADIQLVQGQILRAEDPRAALPLLESVANAYRRMGADSKTSAAMYESAMAARDAGDSARARDWLVQSIAQIERQQTKTETAGGRAALFETADNAFDAMIDLELRAGRKDDAFAYLERERAAAKLSSYTRSTVGPGAAPSLAAIGQRLPRDMLFVEYALLPDRAIVWTSSRRGTNTYVISASRDSVAALVERFVHERSIPAPRGGDARSSLFTLLLGPLSNELEGVKQISVVGDRELSRLPFAALWDTATKQYVVERYRVRTEPSAAFLLAALSAAPASDRRRTALVVGNPAVDSLGIRLESLPGAEREARQVAKLYDAAPLIGPDARRDTVVRLLRANPSVFHFAGHAVFNGDRPELSFLALGPPRAGDGGSTGTLGAWEIGELRLSKLELVVLSACRTVSSRTSRTGGVAGLAASFLRAGAPAIISTLWDVSDDMTGPLLGAFHQRFAKGMSAAEALREAQVEALRQGVSPASWAAFIYAGP